MTKVFLDSDVLLDIAFDRKPHSMHAATILSLCENNKIKGYTSTLILANCYYLIANHQDKATAKNTVSKFRELLTVLDFTNKELGESLQSGFSDIEDGIQHFIAINNSIKTIITRNVEDYKKASISVFKPEEFLRLLSR
ncbi:MAG: PIN domain-containing protein [Fibrobacteres bacterium]|nr:PIN domain-containing protein [Fibrobacterota bacterium]